MEVFGIQIEDGSEKLPEIVREQNQKAIELYDWQRHAINYFFSHNNKAIFEVTTGAGKTFCAIEILKKIHEMEPDLRCLIVVPKNVIMETGWLGELYRNGYNLPEIGVFYGMAKEYGRVTITNMQSLSKVAIELFDIVIFDECFSGDTNVTVRINNKNKNIKIKKIVNKKIFCEVLSYNINKNKYEYKSILKHYQIKEKRKVMKIILEDNTKIILTPEQLIYNGNNYIKANKLKKGDFIQCLEKKK